MSAPIYPTRVTLCRPGPDGTPMTSGIAGSEALLVAAAAFFASVSLARTADTNLYTALDVIGADAAGSPGSAIQEFTSIGPSGGYVTITDVDLEIDIAAVISGMTTFRLHLYNAAPAAILDNAAFNLGGTVADRAKYLGYIDLAAPQDLGATIYSQNAQLNKRVKLATGSTSLFGVLQTIGGYTPASGSVFVTKISAIEG